MSFAERLVISVEFADALLLRLADFKQALSQPRTQPLVLRTLIEKRLWPLTRPNDFDPDNAKFSNAERQGVKREHLQHEFEPFTLLTLDFIDIRTNINKLLHDFSTTYNYFPNDEIYDMFIRVYNKNVQLHLMLASFQQLRQIVGAFLCSVQMLTGQAYPNYDKLHTFLTEFNDPVQYLTRDLVGVGKIVDIAMVQATKDVNAGKLQTNISWQGPLSVYQQDGRLLPQLNTASDDVIGLPEPVDDPSILQLQRYRDALYFSIYGYLLCPEIIIQPQQLQDIQSILQDLFVLPVCHDEVFYPHAAFEQLFQVIKPKGLKIEKYMPPRALEVAVQTGGYKAAVRRTLLLDTGTRLLNFLLEDTAHYIGACVENIVAVLTLIDNEIAFYFAHAQRQLVGRRVIQPKEQDFNDPTTLPKLIDVGVRLRDLVTLFAPEITNLCRQGLALKERRALQFAIDESGRLLDQQAVSMLRKCADALAHANEPSMTTPIVAQRRMTGLQLTRLDLLRVVSDNTMIQSRQYPAYKTLWQIMNRITHRIVTSDSFLFAHHLSPLYGRGGLQISKILHGNMNRYVKLVLLYIDSEALNPDVLTTLIRQPSMLQYLQHPLMHPVLGCLAQESAYLWTKTITLLIIRKFEEKLTQIVVASLKRQKQHLNISSVAELVQREQSASKKDKNLPQIITEPFGKESTFAERDNLNDLSLIQHAASSILVALLGLTGTSNGDSIQISQGQQHDQNQNQGYNTSQQGQGQDQNQGPGGIGCGGLYGTFAGKKNQLPNFFTYNVRQAANPDSFIRINESYSATATPGMGPGGGFGEGNNIGDGVEQQWRCSAINIRAILSVMLRRFLTRAFTHVCLQPIEEFTTGPPTPQLLQKIAASPPNFPFNPSSSPYSQNIMNDCASISRDGVAAGVAARFASQPIGIGKDETLLGLLDYETDRNGAWWNPAYKFPQEQILPIKNGIAEELMPKLYYMKDNEWPAQPSIALAHIQQVIQTVDSVVHAHFPQLQVDEIAQRVLLNLCTGAQFLPSGFAFTRAMPLGAWFYRLFGRERGSWDTDGTEASFTPGVSGGTLLEADQEKTEGYLALIYGKWYAEIFIVGIMAGIPGFQNVSIGPNSNESLLAVYSKVERGFIRPPTSTFGPQPRIQAIIAHTSNYELQKLAELLGPIGIESVTEQIETLAIPRLMERIRKFLLQNNNLFMSVKEVNHQLDIVCSTGDTKDDKIGLRLVNLYQNVEESAAKLKGKEVTDFMHYLSALGSALYLIENMKVNVSNIFEIRSPIQANTLRAIGSSSNIHIDPRYTLAETIRMYGVKAPYAYGAQRLLVSGPPAAVKTTPSGCNYSWDPAFFQYIQPRNIVGYENQQCYASLPYAVQVALVSLQLWTDCAYLNSILGFDTNVHTAARGIVFFAHAVSNLPKSPQSTNVQLAIPPDTPHEVAINRLLFDDIYYNISPHSVLYNILEYVSQTILVCNWGDMQKAPNFAKRAVFLDILYEDMKWLGNETYEALIPRYILTQAKEILSRYQ